MFINHVGPNLSLLFMMKDFFKVKKIKKIEPYLKE